MNNARRDEQWLRANRPSDFTSTYDTVHNPAHYTEGRQYEPIDVIEDWQLPFHLGNALKYIARAGRKDPTLTRQDISKAIWYLERFSDQFVEPEAQARDADELIAAKEEQNEREFIALGEIPSTILFGSDEDAIPFDASDWEYPAFDNEYGYGAAQPVDPSSFFPYGKDTTKFGQDEVIFTETEGDNILGHKANGDVIWLGHAPRSVNYEDILKFEEYNRNEVDRLEAAKSEANPWDQLPSDVRPDFDR